LPESTQGVTIVMGSTTMSARVCEMPKDSRDEIIKPTSWQLRTLPIDFKKGSLQIEIVGTHAVLEFGIVISATILAISIIGIVMATTRFSGLLS